MGKHTHQLGAAEETKQARQVLRITPCVGDNRIQAGVKMKGCFEGSSTDYVVLPRPRAELPKEEFTGIYCGFVLITTFKVKQNK